MSRPRRRSSIRRPRSFVRSPRLSIGRGNCWPRDSRPAREYDQAQAAARTAQGSVDSASAQLSVAQERLGDTQLKAGVAGVITARNVEAGQVVQAAQAAFTIAQDGPRDAVFNVYESLLGGARVDRKVEVALLSDPKSKAWGDVREIAPTVDMTSGTIRVKIGLDNPPAAMTLGALVSGVGHIRPRKVLRLPPTRSPPWPGNRRSGWSIPRRTPFRCAISRSNSTEPTRSSSRTG